MIVDRLYILKTTSSLESYDFIIASYLLAHWQEACSEKMATIISKLGVSKSTLARFCKKLGYRCFTEVQYVLYYEMSAHHKVSLPQDHASYEQVLAPLLKGKRRIIVLGSASALAALLNYVQLFNELHYELILMLKGGSTIDFLNEHQVDENDLIVYVSLQRSNLELQIDYLDPYIETLFWIREHHYDFLYVGKMAHRQEIEPDSIEIQTESISESLFQLGRLFEHMLLCLKQQEDKQIICPQA